MPTIIGSSSGLSWAWLLEFTYLLPASLAAMVVVVSCGLAITRKEPFSGSDYPIFVRDLAVLLPPVVAAQTFLASLDRSTSLDPSGPQEILLAKAFLAAAVTAYVSCLLLAFAYLLARRLAASAVLGATRRRSLLSLGGIVLIPTGTAAFQFECFGVKLFPGDAFVSRQLGYPTTLLRVSISLSDVLVAALLLGSALVAFALWGLVSRGSRPALIARPTTYAFAAIGALAALDVYSSFFAHFDSAHPTRLAPALALLSTVILVTAYYLLVVRVLVQARAQTK